MSRKIYVVTGGAGFIGSHIAARLLKDGHTVRVIDNMFSGRQQNLDYLASLNGDYSFYNASITEYGTILPLLKDAEIVFHQAALVSVPLSLAEPHKTNDICVNGTLNVLYAAKEQGVKRVVYAGSSAAYGNTQLESIGEDVIPAPISPYGVAKLAAEYYCQAFYHSYGLETVVLRYFNVFGERQDPRSAYAAVIPKWITRILQGERPLIFGTGEQTRDFIYIENVVHGNLLASNVPDIGGQVFNMATGSKIDLLQLVDMLNEVMGTNISPIHEPARAGDILHSRANINKAESMLGYTPIVPFIEGLRKTVVGYRGS
jgi:nucleoside-diphosphate-sugar epimerase